MSFEHPLLFSYPIAESQIELTKKDIPSGVKLKFKKIHIRIHNDQELDGYVFVTAGIPNFEDDQGFIWEEDFSDPFSNQEFLSGPVQNSFPKESFSLSDFPENLELNLYKSENSNRINLWLELKIRNSPFRGEILLDDEMFEINALND